MVSNEVPPFEIRASTESAHIHRHAKQKITHNLQKSHRGKHNVLLLIILYSSGIASKCGFQLCAKRICFGRWLVARLSYRLFFSLFSMGTIGTMERLPQHRLVSAPVELWNNICVHVTQVLVTLLEKRVDRKPLKHWEICCVQSCSPSGWQGRLGEPRWQGKTRKHTVWFRNTAHWLSYIYGKQTHFGNVGRDGFM